jgi:hypothetical protein
VRVCHGATRRCGSLTPTLRSERNGWDRRAAHRNGTAFSAVAPSERPVFAAHQIRSSGVVIARIAAPQRSIVLFGSARVLVGEQVWPVCYIPPRKSRACFNDLKMHSSALANPGSPPLRTLSTRSGG